MVQLGGVAVAAEPQLPPAAAATGRPLLGKRLERPRGRRDRRQPQLRERAKGLGSPGPPWRNIAFVVRELQQVGRLGPVAPGLAPDEVLAVMAQRGARPSMLRGRRDGEASAARRGGGSADVPERQRRGERRGEPLPRAAAATAMAAGSREGSRRSGTAALGPKRQKEQLAAATGEAGISGGDAAAAAEELAAILPRAANRRLPEAADGLGLARLPSMGACLAKLDYPAEEPPRPPSPPPPEPEAAADGGDGSKADDIDDVAAAIGLPDDGGKGGGGAAAAALKHFQELTVVITSEGDGPAVGVAKKLPPVPRSDSVAERLAAAYEYLTAIKKVEDLTPEPAPPSIPGWQASMRSPTTASAQASPRVHDVPDLNFPERPPPAERLPRRARKTWEEEEAELRKEEAGPRRRSRRCCTAIIAAVLAAVVGAIAIVAVLVAGGGKLFGGSGGGSGGKSYPRVPVLPRRHEPSANGLPASATCAGACCSADYPLIPPQVEAMPSLWWSPALPDKAQVQLRSTAAALWWPPAGSGAGTAASPQAEAFFTVLRVSGSALRLRCVGGALLVAQPDGSIAAVTAASPPAASVFTVVRPSGAFTADGRPLVALIARDGRYVTTGGPGGTLALAAGAGAAAAPPQAALLEVREVMAVPSFRGANLGDWLVAEEWIRPPLFDGVPLFLDGALVQLQSIWTAMWVSAAGGGTVASAPSPPGNDQTFYLRTADGEPGYHELRASDYSYIRAAPASRAVTADAAVPGSSGTSLLRFDFDPSDASRVMLLAVASGMYLQSRRDGSVTADVPAASVDLAGGSASWHGPTAFVLHLVGGVRGQYQLDAGLGSAAAATVSAHRSAWVGDADFAALAASNVNAVRLPIGWWLAALEAPFVSGGLADLDRAFALGSAHGVGIFLSMHAAPGSQNGYEHSATRDGVPAWAGNATAVAATVAAVDFFAARYAGHAAFLGIGLLNEPTAGGVPLDTLTAYYEAGYAAVRRHSACAFVAVMPRIGADSGELGGILAGDGYTNVILEMHYYNVFDDTFSGQNVAYNLAQVRGARLAEVEALQAAGRMLVVGEWSLALRAEAHASGADFRAFGEVQLATYASARAGWFFWNFKMGRVGWPHWSFAESIARGWLPQKTGGGWQ
eukprot:SM000018S03663  [mRNA]  locus=s18:671311:678637:- [translate_table: standard]